MRTAKIYEVGEEVMIKCRITNVKFDAGNIKYTLADSKGGAQLSGDFTDRDIVSCKSNTKKGVIDV